MLNVKDFTGLTKEEAENKFDEIWKRIEDDPDNMELFGDLGAAMGALAAIKGRLSE